MLAEGWGVEPELSGALLTFGLGLIATVFAAPWVIGVLRQRFRERIVSDSARLNALHASKRGTPTMGGVLMVWGASIGVMLSPSEQPGWGERLLGVLCLVSFSVLGCMDDYVKAVSGRKGLTVWQKLFGQLLLGGALGVWLAYLRSGSGTEPWVAWAASVIWAMMWMVAGSNAVNLTDGLDGLASGSTVLAACSLGAGILIYGDPAVVGWGYLALSLGGSAAGFLWFNRHPARVFMGDAGSLPLGAFLGLCAVAAGWEWRMLLIGFVFAVELMSVVLQVCWYRRTGRRVLLCSPLHNHFVFRGDREWTIVGGFWIVGMVVGAAGVLL
jgi:phospho-N-acetylmuramoyl-pentapeptide-transferase